MTITVTASPVNDPPVAVVDGYTVVEDAVLTVPVATGVLANDSDPDAGTTLTASLVTDVTNGTLVLAADGSFVYTPDTNFVGTDTFTYTADDATDSSAVTTVTITVTASPVNDPPVAVVDGYTVVEDAVLTVPVATGVLANDSDPDAGTTLTASLVTDVTNGTLVLAADGSFVYTPDTNFVGTDTFTYTADDATDSSAVTTVTITVTASPVNDPPVAVVDGYTVVEDAVLTVPVATGVLANDSDPDAGTTLTASLVTDVTNGTLVLAADGSFVYTPDTNFVGTDTFTYTADDATDSSAVTTVTITVTASPVNDPPVAVNDADTVVEDSVANVIDVLFNDSDPDGDTLTITEVSAGIGGTATITGGGTGLTFTPTANFTGAAGFTYTISDGRGGTDTAAVIVNVTPSPLNDAPDAVDDDVEVVVNTPLVIGTAVLLANDTDPDTGDTLTITAVTQGAHGTVALNPNGSLTYTPALNYIGADSFTYTINDRTNGTGLADTATVNVNVVADTGRPAAFDVQTTNVVGGTPGFAEPGDTIVFTFSEPINPGSVLTGWTGSPIPVSVRMLNNGLDGISNDQLGVFTTGTTPTLLPLGVVDLGHKDYVTGAVAGGLGGTAIQFQATMTMSGNTITIVLGTFGGGVTNQSTRRGIAAGPGTMVWTPTGTGTGTMTDASGNLILDTPVSESGAADLDF